MKFIILVLVLFLIINIIPLKKLEAAELENYYLQTSFYTSHYSEKNYKNNQQNLIGIERHYSDNSLNGISFFKNTYEQNTFYIYTGDNYTFFNMGNLQFTGKFTYGIVHGYDDENGKYSTWMHKVETFPALVFGFGLRYEPFRLDIIPFADAGIIVTGGIEF